MKAEGFDQQMQLFFFSVFFPLLFVIAVVVKLLQSGTTNPFNPADSRRMSSTYTGGQPPLPRRLWGRLGILGPGSQIDLIAMFAMVLSLIVRPIHLLPENTSFVFILPTSTQINIECIIHMSHKYHRHLTKHPSPQNHVLHLAGRSGTRLGIP